MPDHSFLSHSCFCKYVFLFCFAFIEKKFSKHFTRWRWFFCRCCCNWSRFRSKSSASDLEVFRVFRCYRSDADANRTDAPFIARAWVQTLSRCSHSWCRDFESNRHKSKETLAGVKNSILFWICANEPLSLTWKDALAYSVNCFCSNFINSTANLKCQLDVSRIMFPVLKIYCRFLELPTVANI